MSGEFEYETEFNKTIDNVSIVTDIALILGTFVAPEITIPLMIAKEGVSVVTGKELGVGRDLGDTERLIRGIFTAVDVGTVFLKGVKVIKASGALENSKALARDIEIKDISKTGEGIPVEKVKPNVLKQIHADDNGAYGYLPNEGTAYYKTEYDFTNVEWAKDMQNVRTDYLKASKQLEIDIEKMTSEGFSKENIAKHVVDARNQQKVTARANMTAEERAGLEARNIEIYSNPIGPDSQWLFNKTKKKLIKEGTYINDDEIWSVIIKKSMKKDDVINTLLGLIH